MNKYYYVEDGKQVGPLTLEELSNKNISGDTLIWCEGMESWTPASNVEELQQIIRSTPPPIPTMLIEINKDNQNNNDSYNDKNDKPKKEEPKTSNNALRIILSILALAIFVFIAWYISSNNENRQKTEQIELQKKEVEAARLEKEAKARRLSQLRNERDKLVNQVELCRQRYEEADEFQLFRTRKEKKAELDEILKEMDKYYSRLIEVDAELVGLGEESIFD